MANSTANRVRITVGQAGKEKIWNVSSGVHIYEGTMVAQLASTGGVVAGSTASSSFCIGVASFEMDDTAATGAKAIMVEDDRTFVFDPGTAGDAIPATTFSGATLYMVDDHTVSTVSTGRVIAGSFRGFDPDGRVRVFISAANNAALAS
jgi:hypothetical protein